MAGQTVTLKLAPASKYFGFALMGSGHIESPDKPVEPGSLFKQQLIERIGAEKAAAVLK